MSVCTHLWWTKPTRVLEVAALALPNRAVEALDSNGERRREERLVYMNGFARAVPTFVISDAARLLLENWGPYTQSFDRVVPVLQPDRLQTVMDDLLCRSVGLLSATTGNAVDTMDVVRRPG